MALSTYAELQTALGTFNYNRTDLPTADLIKLGERRLMRDLRLRNEESDESLTGVVGSRLIALPSGYVSPLKLFIAESWGREELPFVPSGMETTATDGKPESWTIEGEYVAFERELDDDYSFVLRITTTLDLASTSTNWLLTNHPDCYLAAAMVEAALWMEQDDQATRWEARYQAAVAGVTRVEAQSRRTPLRTDLAAQGHFDINRGY